MQSRVGYRGDAVGTGKEKDGEILTSREAREFLKVGRTTLWQLTRDKVIPAYRVGTGKRSSLRYRKPELIDWLGVPAVPQTAKQFSFYSRTPH